MDFNTLLTGLEIVTDVIRLMEYFFRFTILGGAIVILVLLVRCRRPYRSSRTTKKGCPTLNSQGTKNGYSWVGTCATGDLCEVRLVEDSRRRRFVTKTARLPSSNRWLQHERQVLSRLTTAAQGGHYRAYLPWLVDQKFTRGRLSNVFEFREGFFTACQILNYYPQGLDGRHLAWMYKRVLEGLGFVHVNGWVHGAVLPQHMMFHVDNHGLQLVGWCQSAPLGARLRMICKTFQKWYPQEAMQRAPTSQSTDIVLATRSMIYLSGGNPVTGWIPSTIPAAIQRFWNSCLYESPAMRPQDAWQLHEEFTDLLEVVYGPPQYHNLDLIKKGECNGWNSLV